MDSLKLTFLSGFPKNTRPSVIFLAAMALFPCRISDFLSFLHYLQVFPRFFCAFHLRSSSKALLYAQSRKIPWWRSCLVQPLQPSPTTLQRTFWLQLSKADFTASIDIYIYTHQLHPQPYICVCIQLICMFLTDLVPHSWLLRRRRTTPFQLFWGKRKFEGNQGSTGQNPDKVVRILVANFTLKIWEI